MLLINLEKKDLNVFDLKFFNNFFEKKIEDETLYIEKLHNDKVNRYHYNKNKKNELDRTFQSYLFRCLMKTGSLCKALNLTIELNLRIKRRSKKNIYETYNDIILKFQSFIGGKQQVKSGTKFEVPYTVSRREGETKVIRTFVKGSREYKDRAIILTMENEFITGLSSSVNSSNIFYKKITESNILLRNSRGNIKYS